MDNKANAKEKDKGTSKKQGSMLGFDFLPKREQKRRDREAAMRQAVNIAEGARMQAEDEVNSSDDDDEMRL